MTTDESLMFHLTKGSLRRFSLWNEPTLPEWAVGQEEKYRLFQDWKKRRYTTTDQTDEQGQPLVELHPFSFFQNWPYFLILELANLILGPRGDIGYLLSEPEQLKAEIVAACDQMYSDFEKQSLSQLAS